MLGKKKKSEKYTEESENSNTIFKNIRINAYLSPFRKLKKLYRIKIFLFQNQKKQMILFSRILSAFVEDKSFIATFENLLDFSNESNNSIKLLEKIRDGSASPQDQEIFDSKLKECLESIENKLTNLITNLLNTKISKNNNQIPKLIDEGLNDEMVEFLNKEITHENKNLRNELKKLKDLIEIELRQNNQEEIQFLKFELAKKNEIISEMNEKIEELKETNKKTKIKLSASPYLPYIILDKAKSVNLKTHNCICYYCGFEINNKDFEFCTNFHGENNQISNNSHLQNEERKIDRIQQKKNCDGNSQPDIIMSEISNENINKINDKNLNFSPINFNNSNNDYFDSSTKQVHGEKSNIYNNFMGNQPQNLSENKNFLGNTDINLNNNVSSSKNLNYLNNENTNNIINSPHISTDNDIEGNDKQNLNILYKRLQEAYLTLKCEKSYSYQNIIKSKPFQLLLNQIESAVGVIESQKQDILASKKQINDMYLDIKSQERFLKYEKMKDLTILESKIETLQKDFNICENEKLRIQGENTKQEEIIKTLKSFDFSQLNAIDEYYLNKNKNLVEMLKEQAKISTEKYLVEFEKVEGLEKQVMKLTIELDRFKTSLSKYESVEAVENLQFEKFDIREREEMKRQIKLYKDKYTQCEKSYRCLKSDLKLEKENSEKLFMEIVLNEKGIEQMSKSIKELTVSLQENNEKISFLLNEKSKSTETIRNLTDINEKLESIIKESSECEKDLKSLEENYIKEINSNKEMLRKLENLLKFKNNCIDALYVQINQLTRENHTLNNSLIDLGKTLEILKTQNSKKIVELEKACIKVEKSNKNNLRKDIKGSFNFTDKILEDEFELLKLENENYKKKLQCKICYIRDIDVIINKCNHTFCRECITSLVNSRQRICPKCRHKISLKDVSDIWID